MERKSKSKTGLKTEKKVKKTGRDFSSSQRVKIIEEYLSSDLTKREIWKKHTGQNQEKGYILKWMRQFGYQDNRGNCIVKPACRKIGDRNSSIFANKKIMEKLLSDKRKKNTTFVNQFQD